MTKRTLSEQQYRTALETLARVSAVAFSLRENLTPLTPEDIAAGAEPLSQEQVHEALDAIANEMTVLALDTLGATREEWFAADGKVQ
jgi:hypothetical protein